MTRFSKSWPDFHQLAPLAPAVEDPDMLLVGGFGLSVSEAQSQFALWSLFAAPLFMSNDLRGDISQEARDILQNREVIAVNQEMKMGMHHTREWGDEKGQGRSQMNYEMWENFDHECE
jgi:hypothetical protein